jgi:hypothetical protein
VVKPEPPPPTYRDGGFAAFVGDVQAGKPDSLTVQVAPRGHVVSVHGSEMQPISATHTSPKSHEISAHGSVAQVPPRQTLPASQATPAQRSFSQLPDALHR